MAGKITALRVQKKNKNRVNVYVDGQFAFGLAAIEAAKLIFEAWRLAQDRTQEVA